MTTWSICPTTRQGWPARLGPTMGSSPSTGIFSKPEKKKKSPSKSNACRKLKKTTKTKTKPKKRKTNNNPKKTWKTLFKKMHRNYKCFKLHKNWLQLLWLWISKNWKRKIQSGSPKKKHKRKQSKTQKKEGGSKEQSVKWPGWCKVKKWKRRNKANSQLNSQAPVQQWRGTMMIKTKLRQKTRAVWGCWAKSILNHNPGMTRLSIIPMQCFRIKKLWWRQSEIQWCRSRSFRSCKIIPRIMNCRG